MKRGLLILVLSSIPHSSPMIQSLEEPFLSSYRPKTEEDKYTLWVLQKQLSYFPPEERLWAMERITYLDLSREKIKSLGPLVLFKELKWLRIRGDFLQEEGSLSLLALKKLSFIQWEGCSLSLSVQNVLKMHLERNRRLVKGI